jgi:predicted alpha/beta superfamily hydrolase
MIHMSRICPFIACVSLAVVKCAGAQQLPETQTFPRVTIPNTEVRTLKSSVTKRGYELYVFLPSGYAQSKGKKYPVLYVLDGQWDFQLLVSVYGGLLFDGFVPEMIIVGITYSGDSPNYGALRSMDYTPTPIASVPGSGDAPKFLAFFKQELIPFIEANYRADRSQRVLLGASSGGLFTLYALFTEPGLFRSYVAACPDVPYGDRFAFKQEAEYAGKHRELPVTLFLSVGAVEVLARPVEEFAEVVRGRGYRGLRMESRVIPGERHGGAKPESFNRGLRFVFHDE